MEKLDGARRCFRMVGGVLVERTVGEVLPAVRENMVRLEELLQRLYASLNEKETKLMEWKAQYQHYFQPQQQQQLQAQ